MNAFAYIAQMRGFAQDVASSPETLKGLMQLMELVEEQQGYIHTLLIANKKLLDVIEELKK
jgi:type II secretory pathway predicted ATPase ExeA